MANTIDALMNDPGSTSYYTDAFRVIIDDHVTYLRQRSDTRIVNITPIQIKVYEFDLIGLLNELGIPMKLHWVVMRVNKLTSLTYVPEDLTSLLIPSESEISKLEQVYKTSSKLN